LLRGALLAAIGSVLLAGPAAAAGDRLAAIDHFLVVYQENHSFDNLYGGWEGIDGVADAARRAGCRRRSTPRSATG
jgi:phospholipase C